MYKIVINEIINIIKILYTLFFKEKFIKYNLVTKIKENYKLILQKPFPFVLLATQESWLIFLYKLFVF
jgi:hypothetical protein